MLEKLLCFTNAKTADVGVCMGQHLEHLVIRAQEVCESRGGRPELPIPNKPDGFCGHKATLK